MADAASSPSRKVRWIARRNRLFASTRFQYWAARLPFIKSVARSRATAMFDHLVGFSYSQVLRACVESGLLDLLAEGPVDSASIAERTELSHEAALVLLRAARALDVAKRSNPMAGCSASRARCFRRTPARRR